jgi:hypothetical protein
MYVPFCVFCVLFVCLQTFTDTPNCVLEDRVQYSTVPIANVLCDGHLRYHDKWLKLFKTIISCTETFDHPVYHTLYNILRNAGLRHRTRRPKTEEKRFRLDREFILSFVTTWDKTDSALCASYDIWLKKPHCERDFFCDSCRLCTSHVPELL